ncbi:type II toxin-antitoxin system HicB family antitoxin [Pseudoduganella sp. OTU4001]|uniref:type II toxin-antitoxin system HicB family antitoxin n=1 Tax=Pseudoduganella sp. OTU4001 TaxID=3043854 RepID=UPI00313BCE94
MLNYPVTLIPDEESLLVEFTDFPDAHSVGDTVDDALREAVDGLITAVEMYMEDRRLVPMPSTARKGQHTVTLPALETAKVLLWNEMLNQRLRKADLARMLNVYQPQIDRLFDLRHSSKLDFVEQAATVMGRSLSVQLV